MAGNASCYLLTHLLLLLLLLLLVVEMIVMIVIVIVVEVVVVVECKGGMEKSQTFRVVPFPMTLSDP